MIIKFLLQLFVQWFLYVFSAVRCAHNGFSRQRVSANWFRQLNVYQQLERKRNTFRGLHSVNDSKLLQFLSTFGPPSLKVSCFRKKEKKSRKENPKYLFRPNLKSFLFLFRIRFRARSFFSSATFSSNSKWPACVGRSQERRMIIIISVKVHCVRYCFSYIMDCRPTPHVPEDVARRKWGMACFT